MALLEVKGLRTVFRVGRGTINAVNDVSFSINAGETLGLVGESGSGKSMTSLSLLRLVPSPGEIVGGSIMFDGVDLLRLSDREMRDYRGRHLSMILQDPLSSLNPVFKVGNQIGEGITIHEGITGGRLRQRVLELLRQVDIPAPATRIDNYPHQFSGGMRQRVVGAVALACRPQLLIADEPTTALDVTIQMQYLNLLKDIQQRDQLAMLFVTHDLGVVAKMCDHVAVMYAGRIVEIGPVREIFKSPKHPYTRALLRSVPRIQDRGKRLSSIEGQPPSMLNQTTGCAFVPRCPERLEKCNSPEFPPEVDVSAVPLAAPPTKHCARCWHYV